MVKTFINVALEDIEQVVGEWLKSNTVKVVTASQSQLQDTRRINLTIFYEHIYQKAPPR